MSIANLIYRACYVGIFAWGAHRIYSRIFRQGDNATATTTIDPPGYRQYYVGCMRENGEVLWWWRETRYRVALARHDVLVNKVGLPADKVIVRGDDGRTEFHIVALYAMDFNLYGITPKAIIENCKIGLV